MNCSILDGWWVGHTSLITTWLGDRRGEQYSDPNYQDALESQSLYNILEKQMLPLF